MPSIRFSDLLEEPEVEEFHFSDLLSDSGAASTPIRFSDLLTERTQFDLLPAHGATTQFPVPQMAQPPTREGAIHVPPSVDQNNQAVERMAAIFDEAEKERKKSDPSVVERWLAPVEPEKGGVMGVAANVRPDKVIGQIVSFFVEAGKTALETAKVAGMATPLMAKDIIEKGPVDAYKDASMKVYEMVGGLGKFGWDYAKYGTIVAGLGPDGWAPYQDIISRKASGKPMTLPELREKYPTFAEAAEAVYANPAGPFMAMSMVKGVIPGRVGTRVAETPAESAAMVKQANRAAPDIQANVAAGRIQRGLDKGDIKATEFAQKEEAARRAKLGDEVVYDRALEERRLTENEIAREQAATEYQRYREHIGDEVEFDRVMADLSQRLGDERVRPVREQYIQDRAELGHIPAAQKFFDQLISGKSGEVGGRSKRLGPVIPTGARESGYTAYPSGRGRVVTKPSTIPRTSVRLSDLTREPTPEATVPLETEPSMAGSSTGVRPPAEIVSRETSAEGAGVIPERGVVTGEVKATEAPAPPRKPGSFPLAPNSLVRPILEEMRNQVSFVRDPVEYFISEREYQGLGAEARQRLGPVKKTMQSNTNAVGGAEGRQTAGAGGGEEGYVYQQSSVPKWAKDYKSGELDNMIDKALRGDPMTENQVIGLRQAIDSYKTEMGYNQPTPRAPLSERTPRGVENIPAGDLKVGQQVKVGDEWLDVTRNKGGEIVIKDGITITLDEFDKVAVEGGRAKGIREGMRTETTPSGEQGLLGDVGRRQVPTEPIREIKGRPVKAPANQGDAFQPGKIEYGNLPQDQASMFDKAPAPPVAEKGATKGDLVPPKPPKVEAPSKPVSEPDNVVGLRHEDINVTRERVGLPKLEKTEAETQQQWFDEATRTGAMHTAVESARESARTGRAQTPVEHMGAVQKAAQLETGIKESMERAAQKIKEGDDAAAQAESARTMRLLEDLNTLTTAKYKTGSQAGKDLAALKTRIDTEIWGPAHILQVARQRKGSKLSSAEVKRYGNMADKLQKLEADYKTLEAENAKLAAEQSQAVAERVAKIEAERARIGRRSAGTRDKIQSEKAAIKKRLEELGYRLNDITGATAEGSYLIGRWAVAKIREAVLDGTEKVELNTIVDQVMKDIPGISKLDVYEALNAKSPDRIAKAKSTAQAEVANLKKQAKIAAATERLLQRDLPELDMTAQLMDQLTDMRAQLYKSDALPVEVLERGLERINDLQGQLQGHYREIKKSRPKTTTPEMAEIKAEIVKLTKELRAEDTLADLQEQLRTGDYKIRPKRQKPFVSPQFERNQIEIKRMRQAIIQALESEAPMTVGRGMREAGDFLRAMKATADVSGTLRQGLVLVSRRAFTDPIGLAKRFGQSLDAMFRKYTDEKIDNSRRSHPNYYKAVEAKLDLTEHSGRLSKREEMIRSNLAERIPVFGKVVAASERQYRTFLNLLRTDAFYKFLDSHPNATQAEMTAIADVINVFSGRGNPGKWGGVMSSLSTVGFAPKYALSRIQTPDMIRKYWKEPRVRKEIAKDYAATAAFGGSILLLAHLNGFEVGMDPRDADFGKVRIGNSRFDVWGGLQQPMRAIFRSILWATDSQGWTGQGLTKSEKGMDPLELVGQFASYKLAPLVTVPYEWIGGKSVIGEDVPSLKSVFDASKEGLGAGALEAGKMVGGAIVPMMMEDIAEAYRDDPGMAIPVASAVLLGIGASTYEDRESTIRRKIRRLKVAGKNDEANEMQREWNEKVLARAKKETDRDKRKKILEDYIYSVEVPKE